MTASPHEPLIADWLATDAQLPADSGVPSGAELTRQDEHLSRGRSLLGRLPAPRLRSAAETSDAALLLTAMRARADLVANRHAGRIYDELTDRGQRRLPLVELVDLAAQRYPGLVPAAAARLAERLELPADRDHLDIDVALLLRALLRNPESGEHLLDTMRMPTPAGRSAAEALSRDGKLELASVSVHLVGPVAHLTLNNVDTLNAEDDQLVADLETSVDAALLSERVEVAVLRGAVMRHSRYAGRRVLSAGINLKHLGAGRISYLGFLLQREFGFISKMIRGLPAEQPLAGAPAITKPWLVVVDGFAIGGGMQLVLAADYVLAAEDAWFSLPAAQEGIVPGMANLRLPRVAGAGVARRMILAGARVNASDPDARTFCDEAIPAGQLDDRVQPCAESLAGPAVRANKLMLGLAQEPQAAFRHYAAEFCLVQAERMYSPDVLDKLGSFARRSEGAS